MTDFYLLITINYKEWCLPTNIDVFYLLYDGREVKYEEKRVIISRICVNKQAYNNLIQGLEELVMR
jgi:hypothetical protein